jgi:hypothetical protein
MGTAVAEAGFHYGNFDDLPTISFLTDVPTLDWLFRMDYQIVRDSAFCTEFARFLRGSSLGDEQQGMRR